MHLGIAREHSHAAPLKMINTIPPVREKVFVIKRMANSLTLSKKNREHTTAVHAASSAFPQCRQYALDRVVIEPHDRHMVCER